MMAAARKVVIEVLLVFLAFASGWMYHGLMRDWAELRMQMNQLTASAKAMQTFAGYQDQLVETRRVRQG